MTNASSLPCKSWRKSSYSGQNGGNCLEVAVGHPGPSLPVRDSKNPHGPALLVAPHAWQAFIAHARADGFGRG
ncbi:DUF397 domain-containing protein [Streptomyces smyrnaeus]|uniref:DUF397 domain-containing protein n=1 Tax=Streptomyces TaxID=1883 RepID=UPI001B38F320|nr:DUF397 domain-containing protein [Streptomyces sp. B15]MBQ1119239.1 DUF397 domain-containing protein [Streptomyces sp. B15]MBQ1158244.1 DUF397 domain-containing protein [Streptomyces sp. A73]